MIAYNKITKRELYEMCVNTEISNLESQLVPHSYNVATMYHAHHGGSVPHEFKHLLVRGTNPHIPDLNSLLSTYGAKEYVVGDYRRRLININKELDKLRRVRDEE